MKTSPEESHHVSGQEVLPLTDLWADVTVGMSVDDLLAKYQVSEQMLRLGLETIVEKGWLKKEDIEKWESGCKAAAPMTWNCPACDMPHEWPFETCPKCGVIIKKFLEKKKEELTKQRNVESEGEKEAQLGQNDVGSQESINQATFRVDSTPPPVYWFAGSAGVILAIIYLAIRPGSSVTSLAVGGLALYCSLFGCYGLTSLKGYGRTAALLAGISPPIGPIVIMLIPYTETALKRKQKEILARVSYVPFRYIYDNFVDPKSPWTSMQKERDWKFYDSKWVRWTGRLLDVSANGRVIQVQMDEDATLTMRISSKVPYSVQSRKKLDEIDFVGRLCMQRYQFSPRLERLDPPCIYLEDVFFP